MNKDTRNLIIAEFAGLPVPEIKRTAVTLGGEPAEQLEIVPGCESSRDVFMVRDGMLFHFMLELPHKTFPDASAVPIHG